MLIARLIKRRHCVEKLLILRPAKSESCRTAMLHERQCTYCINRFCVTTHWPDTVQTCLHSTLNETVHGRETSTHDTCVARVHEHCSNGLPHGLVIRWLNPHVHMMQCGPCGATMCAFGMMFGPGGVVSAWVEPCHFGHGFLGLTTLNGHLGDCGMHLHPLDPHAALQSCVTLQDFAKSQALSGGRGTLGWAPGGRSTRSWGRAG